MKDNSRYSRVKRKSLTLRYILGHKYFYYKSFVDLREKVTNFLLKKKKEKRKTLHCLNKRLRQHPLIYMYRSIDEKRSI